MCDRESVSLFAGMAGEDDSEFVQSVNDDGTGFFIIQVPYALVPDRAAKVPYYSLDIVASVEAKQLRYAFSKLGNLSLV
ncbi:hypothetical protein ACMZ4X_04942 [Achromobacter marplatensis]